MEETAWILATCAFVLVILEGRRITALQREVDLLVEGDTETLKLRRKLAGIPASG